MAAHYKSETFRIGNYIVMNFKTMLVIHCKCNDYYQNINHKKDFKIEH